MALRDIITIGGSAGGVESLRKLVQHLPADFPATVFVTLHIPTHHSSELATVLGRASGMPAFQAVDGQDFEPGRIYVAPPDHHLLIVQSHIHLTRGPKEGLHRPSINVTFRSAAVAYGPRVIGVLLSGMLDDGASGLWEIVQHGGIAIVQDPKEARFPSMPMTALADVPINFKLSADEIGHVLNDLVAGRESPPASDRGYVNELSPASFSGFTCPECHGPLYVNKALPVQYQCRVGHTFSLDSLLEQSAVNQERKMYEALVALEEGSDLAELAAKKSENGDSEKLLLEAERIRRHAAALRKLIEEPRPESVPQPHENPVS